MHTFESLLSDIKNTNLKPTDNILIHSSLKSVGPIKNGGQTLIDVLTDYFKNLIIFPTHTWGYIQKDGDTFDVLNSSSNVGALTNIARNTPGFVRSNHPTHSVCCYGEGNLEYIQKDEISSTPTKASGCFGVLKDIDAKIVFIGAPLSKNTFIHAIEEYMNVPNRFTKEKVNFKTKKIDGKIIDYNVFRHYNEKCPHISNNYEKLLPIMIQKNICYQTKIGDAVTFVVDAKKCFELVVKILKLDISAFDDNRDIAGLIT